MITFEMQGTAELRRELEQASRNLRKEAADSIQEAGIDHQRKAKQDLPPHIDTGRLLNSIQYYPSSDRLAAEVTAETEYAEFIDELGDYFMSNGERIRERLIKTLQSLNV
jgi:hypothetical protein